MRRWIGLVVLTVVAATPRGCSRRTPCSRLRTTRRFRISTPSTPPAFHSGNGQALANVYTPDGSFSVAGKVQAQGRDALTASTKPHEEGVAHVRHINANIALEATADGAHGTAYVCITMVQPGQGIAATNGGSYDDVIVKTAQGWRFKTRNFTPWMPLQMGGGR